MKGIKLILLSLVMLLLAYAGVFFIEGNREEVVITLGSRFETPPLALGFVVLSSVVVGMMFAGILCLYEILVLTVQNGSLKRRLAALETKPKTESKPKEKKPVKAAPEKEKKASDPKPALPPKAEKTEKKEPDAPKPSTKTDEPKEPDTP